MQRLLCASLMFFAAAGLTRADDGKFTSTLSPDDLTAAGLVGLSPDQRARLDELVERYRNGPVAAAARPAVPVAQPAPVPAETMAAAPAPAVPVLSGRKAARAKAAPVESSLPGKFSGWGPRQIFVLANGQRWQVANGGSYYTPVVENPRVQIVPSAFSGHWLRFPDLDVQVRVTSLDDN
jgi:hypothetical protein